MRRFEAEPAPALRPFVDSYWSIARDFGPAGHFTVTPDCYPEVVFFVDPPSVEITGRERQRLFACTVIPLLHEPLSLVMTGLVRCAAIRLHAWAAGIVCPAIDRPPFDLAPGACYDGTALFQTSIDPVIDALQRDAWRAIPPLFDAMLVRLFADARATAAPDSALDIRAVRPFLAAPDPQTISSPNEIAATYGRSRRQLERHVRALTNRSPGQLVALRRFQFVRDALWARPDCALDALASEAGYSDQAHLTREFRRYAAQTPGAFKRACTTLRAERAALDVAIVQDSTIART